MLLATAADTVALWLSRKFIDKDTNAALKAVFAVRDRQTALQVTIKRLDKERGQIHAEQKRLRDNLAALGDRTSEVKLRERLVQTLTSQEDRLAAMDAEGTAAAAELEAVAAELAAKVEAVESDRG